MFDNNKFTNAKFYITLYYYRYFNPYIINHYNVINKLLTYKFIGLTYFKKYPQAQHYENLNEKLFRKNPTAKTEFIKSMESQEMLKKSIINDINLICNYNKNCEICCEHFQSLYIKEHYHIEQNISAVVDYIKDDIIKNKL
jgi:hypothetical protein